MYLWLCIFFFCKASQTARLLTELQWMCEASQSVLLREARQWLIDSKVTVQVTENPGIHVMMVHSVSSETQLYGV